ncbi:MAG: hypothetical protein AAF366_09930, partial [Pseudomonadota bacterium]
GRPARADDEVAQGSEALRNETERAGRMTTEDAPCRVWWFEGFWEEMPLYAPIQAYADYGHENPVANLGQLSKELKGREVRFTSEHGPNCLYVSRPQWGDNRDFDDLSPIAPRGFLVSGKMIDLLAEFDLGDTQILELPVFEGLGTPTGEDSNLKEPDLSRPVPGRWGLLHVLATKDALYDEGCEGIDFRVRKHWLENPPLMASVPYRSKKTILALDFEAACTGADLWFDKRISTVPFISERLRLAIEEAGLRVPTMKWLKEAKLIEVLDGPRRT